MDLDYAPSSQIGLRTCAIGIKHELGALTNHPILVRLRGWGGSTLRQRERERERERERDGFKEIII